MRQDEAVSGSLLSPLESLRAVLGQVRIPLLVPGADTARAMAATFANQLDTNVQYVNDTEVTGNVQSGTEWGPA